MAGEAGKQRTVLLATEKAFAAGAVTKIESVVKAANYTLKKLENYKGKDDLLAAVEGADAMIIRSDIVDAAVLEKANQLKIVVRAGAGDSLKIERMIVSARNNFDGTSGFELVNREIAFYGFGAVARAVHKLAQGFGMKSFAYDPYIPADKIKEMGAEPVSSVAGLFEHQYVSLHVPLTDETKASINKALLSKMPKGGTLINTARVEVVHEADMLEVLSTRSDFCYLCDVAPKDIEPFKAAVGDKFGKRLIFTKKKMGAQTAEANDNAGVAAANQIVGFFEKGETRFSLKA
ncbi:D-3-phosphoglycerate dehydrogenase (PGDH) [Durusdinium trenchii]|uniref:D-3-phosphoglycerate dehydrogenase (PGDH) n=1 Tax=Durusdinium trenchii TaxID=1381693 RepID=A0ABP0KS80_9DINO|eukprot:g13830.t1